ncbi:MAG: hypothetical protein ACLUD9_03115 [Anaerotignum faecicola]
MGIKENRIDETVLLTIAYDGTNYSGWQKQKDEAVITVEGELTKAAAAVPQSCVGVHRRKQNGRRRACHGTARGD